MNLFGKELGPNNYPVIVAEISCNHGGCKNQAFKLIDAAKKSGADAVKIQIYTPDDMTIEMGNSEDFIIKEGPWKDKHLYNLYYKTQTDLHLAREMVAYAKEINFPLFASVFSIDTLNIIQEWDLPAYKIASFEITDIPLVTEVAKKGKPVIISTGMASPLEITHAVRVCDIKNIVLMHCISAYPTKIQDTNLWKINYLRRVYKCPIGFSDHTRSLFTGGLAVANGAVILEKHLQIGTIKQTEDESFSLFPTEFEYYVEHARKVAEAGFKKQVLEEEQSRQFRRSLYAVKDIKEGEKFTKENVRSIRPSYGLKPILYEKVLEGKSTQDIKAGTALEEDMVDWKW